MSPSAAVHVLASGRPQVSSGGVSLPLTAGDMHFSATSVTLTGSEVASMIDLNDATNTFTPESASVRPAQPAADSALGNALSMTFASDTMISTKAASFWTFIHDGTGYESFMVMVPTAITGTQSWLWNGSSPGIDHGMDGGNFYHAIFQAAGGTVVFSTPALGMTVGTATYVNHSYSTAAGWVLRRKSTVLGSGSQAMAPATGAAANTMRIGSDGFNRASFRLAALIIFKRVLSSGDRTTVQSWIQSTYGIAP